jgi:serine/threonine-protein kinase
MAPEQLRNRGASRATDVYAAAVMFWEALVGRRLFDGDGEAAVLEQVLLGFVEPPSAVGEVPVALDDVVLRGLERDPARRYATAREMAEAIEAVAPLAKTAEVAAWVESRAGDLLRARAERIRAIERGQGGSAAAARWLLEANGKRSIVRVPARRGAWLTAPVIALAAAAVTAYAVRNAPSVQSLQAMRPPVVVAVSTAAPEAPPAAAEPAPVSALIDIDDPALSPAPPAANLSGAKPRRPAPAAARPSCDPPFTRDALGRKIYKRECLR